jgi:hypothetical protein
MKGDLDWPIVASLALAAVAMQPPVPSSRASLLP